MEALELFESLTNRGLRLIAAPPKLLVEPSRLLTDADRQAIRAHKATLLLILLRSEQVEMETNRLANADGWRPLPEHDSAARSLMRTCREYGVGLRVDPDGTLVIESHGRAWRSLITAIEAHADAIAVLIESGWTPIDA